MNSFKYTSLGVLLWLTACAPLKSPPESGIPESSRTKTSKLTEQVEHHKNQRSSNSLTSWELSGAIAAKNHKKGWTASLNWHQQGPNHYQIRLFGPLGGGAILIEKHNAVITYRDGPKIITAKHADKLLQEQTGIRLPVANLYYWIRGIPAPGKVQSITRDMNHHILTLKQAQYTIDYSNYTTINQMDLPTKISLQGHELRIKLIIKHWDI